MKCLEMLTVLPEVNGLQIFCHILMPIPVTCQALTKQCSFMCCVGTPTCHSISYSIPFHLTALLPLSIHQSAHRSSQQHLNHRRKPLYHSLLLCLLPNKGNGPWQTELHPTSHAYQLCQPANGRADWTAGDLYNRSPSNNKKQFIQKGVTVNNTPKRKLGKTGGMTARPQCLVDRAHHRSSGTSSSSPSEPVAAASIPPRTSGQSTA